MMCVNKQPSCWWCEFQLVLLAFIETFWKTFEKVFVDDATSNQCRADVYNVLMVVKIYMNKNSRESRKKMIEMQIFHEREQHSGKIESIHVWYQQQKKGWEKEKCIHVFQKQIHLSWQNRKNSELRGWCSSFGALQALRKAFGVFWWELFKCCCVINRNFTFTAFFNF